MGEGDLGIEVTAGQAKDLITGLAKTVSSVDITWVPLNFPPMTGKLNRGLED